MSEYIINKVPRDIGYYLVGFVDSAGTFCCVVRPKKDHKLGWQFALLFYVINRDIIILSQLKKHLGCGIIRERKDGCYVFQVGSTQLLKTHVVPFFKKFQFRSATKKAEFHIFQKLVDLKESPINTKEKALEFLAFRQKLDGNRKKTGHFIYTDQYILDHFRDDIEKSPETIR